MRRAIAYLMLAGAVAAAAPASASNLDLRLGAFIPRANTGAQNDLLSDDSVLYSARKSDWRGLSGGAQFNVKVAPNVEIGFSVDGYSRTLHTSYRDYEWPSGADIRQTLKWTVVPMGATLRLVPTSRSAKIAPFLGAGADLFYWRYEEYGDFVDFGKASHAILADSFFSEGVTPGFHVSAGIRVPIGDDFGLVAEGRYQWGKADMGDDFKGNKLDLTGASVTVGLNIRF